MAASTATRLIEDRNVLTVLVDRFERVIGTIYTLVQGGWRSF
jgi:hypothetical protein